MLEEKSKSEFQRLSMAVNQKIEHVGELIRQLRRQRNLTQTELGANRYSKSYVSGVEKNTIRPSVAALRFFAEQLGQFSDYFTTLLESIKTIKQDTMLPGPLEVGSHFLQDDGFSLLMQHTEPLSLENLKGLPLLTPEVLAGFPLSKQSYYFLLQGLSALANQEYETALQALERALPLAPPQLQPQVLDALGQYYSLTGFSSIALHYHLRALDSLEHAYAQEVKNPLFFIIALHCGEDYQTLGNYEQACMMYEQTRKHLRAEHEMKAAAHLYLGLGYCAYALAYQESQMPQAAEKALAGEMEQKFQQAISYIVQSRNIYQVINDREGEATTRLIQIMALLDYITRYRQLISPISPIGATFVASSLSFLDNAQEQCQQVLIRWDDVLIQKKSEPQQDSIIYAALGLLLKISIQRAILARLRGQQSSALKERMSAAYLCQHILDALLEPVLSPKVVPQILAKQSFHSMLDSPSLPRLPKLHVESTAFQPRFTGLVEIYGAAGEIAEELGRTATSSDFRHECYSQADRCFHMVLAFAQTIVSTHERDPGYLLRHYQRNATLLEERLAASPEDHEETSSIIAALMQKAFAQITVTNQ